MKIKSPHPIYLEGSRKEAILLLHSFTGTVRDVKPLAKALNEENFTCFAPNYQGHGLPLDQFTQFTIQDWWNDVYQSSQTTACSPKKPYDFDSSNQISH